MSDNKDELKTLDTDGHDQVTVHERLRHFTNNYPNGGLDTQISTVLNDPNIILKVWVTPGWKDTRQRRFTGHSMAVYNEDDEFMKSALEIAETSAIGRALGAMGIGITDGFAS